MPYHAKSPSKQRGNPSKQVKKKKKKESRAAQPLTEEDDLFQEPIKRIVKPPNQLTLSEKELKEEITCVLTGDDPNVPNGISKFSFKDQCFKPEPPGLNDHMAVHFALRSNILHMDSDEYKVLVTKSEDAANAVAEETQANTIKQENNEKDSEDGENISTVDSRGTNENTSTEGNPKINRFNYSERLSQIFTSKLRSRGVSTEPPPLTQYSDNVSQWAIYDSYLSDYLVGQMEKDTSAERHISFEDRLAVILEDGGDGQSQDDMKNIKMIKALMKVERLVNQNAQDEIYQDFKYWEDASDRFRNNEGSLLPLWRFVSDKSKKKHVTSLCWNPRQSDLFAVGYGSNEFLRQGSGLICCFTIKNTSFPEFMFSTESGVMSLDFHPQHPSLLAVGCYDGAVMVFNLSNMMVGGDTSSATKPIYQSTIKTGKHTDPVWQVHWEPEELGKELNFYSVSSDGKVSNWSMSKNELKMETVMQLKLVASKEEQHQKQKQDNNTTEANDSIGLAGGCCFDFNLKKEQLFLVGTEEGNIHKCSKAYSGQYLETYEGHHMTVYSVKWNPFHERIFLTCSEDWTVKIWDHTIPYPLMSFDLSNAVGDACWSPYSSTVFTALTNDGKVHIFDLFENKHEPLCQQKIVKRAKLTKIKFNPCDFILIVGDDRGGVNSLKLSPNLRKLHLPVDGESNVLPDLNIPNVQFEKLEKLLSSIDDTTKSSG